MIDYGASLAKEALALERESIQLLKEWQQYELRERENKVRCYRLENALHFLSEADRDRFEATYLEGIGKDE